MRTPLKPLINLLRGWPNPSLLPVAQIRAAAEACLADHTISTPGLLYGPDEGYQPLREQVAAWLTSFYGPGDPISPERICITGGASQNLACILQVFSDPIYTRNVWMVSPTYFMACRIFEDSGFGGRLRSVPEDDTGIDIAFLREGLRKSEEDAVSNGNVEPKLKLRRTGNKIYRHIIYAVPTFANPSSKVMTLPRREDLVKIARDYDALVVSDDVYDQLQWKASSMSDSPLESATLPRLVDIDRVLGGGAERQGADGFGNTVSNGSFSKIAGPGCRTGWAEGSVELSYALSQTGSSRSGGAPSQLTATFMSRLLDSGDLQQHILHVLQPAYARRYHSTMSAVRRELFPLGITVPTSGCEVAGGYFIWLLLPIPLLAAEVAVRAKSEENLIIASGLLFGVSGDVRTGDLERGVRISFAWEDERTIADGINRLARVIDRMLEEREGGQKKGQSSIDAGALEMCKHY